MLKFDNLDLIDTANAIARLNPSWKTWGMTKLALIRKMQLDAAFYLEPKGFGYLSTMGYVLSAYMLPDGAGTGIKASISPSLMRRL